ncbi:DUF3558 family protein [Saccharopolyspora hordei]|uniref:DUF3558 family protein n=1 Tax=Saccharopolyspora hordei TaxID=1838 RepID=UPI0031EFC6F0
MTVHTTRTTLIIATSAITLGLAGCATPGTPEPTPRPETSTAANDPFNIDQPKNLAAVSAPCQLLSQNQLQELSAGQAEPGESEWGQENCRWSNQLFAVNISPDTVQGQGISWMAKTAGDNGKPDANVNGYPAVHYAETGVHAQRSSALPTRKHSWSTTRSAPRDAGIRSTRTRAGWQTRSRGWCWRTCLRREVGRLRGSDGAVRLVVRYPRGAGPGTDGVRPSEDLRRGRVRAGGGRGVAGGGELAGAGQRHVRRG